MVLASTATALVDRLSAAMYKILEEPNAVLPPVKFPTAAEMAPLAGTYDLGGAKLKVTAEGKRLYLEGPGEPRHRMMPLSDHEFLIEALQSVAVFEKEGDTVKRLVFGVGERTITAPRVESK